MSLAPYRAPQNPYLEPEHDTPMLESLLTFLATLVTVRTNIGNDECGFKLKISLEYFYNLILLQGCQKRT